jgi:hypothetical protein
MAFLEGVTFHCGAVIRVYRTGLVRLPLLGCSHSNRSTCGQLQSGCGDRGTDWLPLNGCQVAHTQFREAGLHVPRDLHGLPGG